MFRIKAFLAGSICCLVFFSSSPGHSSCGRGFLSDEEFLRTLELPSYGEILFERLARDTKFVATSRLGESRDIVVRFSQSNWSDPRFEVFASRFARSSGRSITPAVVLVDFGPETKEIFPYVDSIASIAVFKRGLRLPLNFFKGRITTVLTDSQSRDLADHWALTVLLGIHDLHPENWGITREGEFIGIDLAYKTHTFMNGDKSYPHSMRDPFYDKKKMKPGSKKFLLEHITDEMITFLRELNDEWINRIALETEFEIMKGEIEGILLRAQLLLKDLREVQGE